MGRVVIAHYERRYIMIDISRGDGAIHEGTAEGVQRVIEKMNFDGHQPIHFFIHGHDGGDFYACMKIAQAISLSASPVTMVPFIRVRSGAFMLTQAGEGCLAVAGTRFIFHHATDYFAADNLKDRKLSQIDYARMTENLKRIDAMQLLFFTRYGRPIKLIFDLFGREANLSVAQARKLKLVGGSFDAKEFSRIRAMMHAMR